jgi:signal transduction histidine kinase
MRFNQLSAQVRERTPASAHSASPLLASLVQRRPAFATIGVAVPAGAIVVAAAPYLAALDPTLVLFLLAVVAVAEYRTLALFDRSSYSISVVPILAAGPLLGVPGAVLVAPLPMLIRGILRGSRWYKVLFNISTLIIASAAAAAVYGAIGAPLAPTDLPALLPSALLAGLAFYGLNTSLVATGMASEMLTSPLRIWSENFRWLAPHYVVLSLLGLLLALAYQAFGMLGGAAFVVPALMMHYVAKQYVDRITVVVHELRAAKEELEAEVSHRMAAEAENQRLLAATADAAALRELSRLKDEFIGQVSHELRTPLAIIHGYSELMAAGHIADPVGIRKAAESVYDSSVLMLRLVEDLLDTSRLASPRLVLHDEVVDLAPWLARTASAFAQATPTHQVVPDLPASLPLVRADLARLGQVLNNLLSNAACYSPNGSVIHVTARAVGGANSVEIRVADEGAGIAPEDRERIFEKFYRGKNGPILAVRGTGLGLAVAKALVEAHGGEIGIESEVGHGSTFWFRLPAASTSPSPLSVISTPCPLTGRGQG